MGNAPALRGHKLREAFAPPGAFHGYQPVVCAVKMSDQRVSHIQGKSAAGSAVHLTAHTLIIYVGAVGQLFVSGLTGGGGEVAHGGEKVGIGVAEFFQGRIVLSGYAFLHPFRYFFQQIVCENTAPVRGIDGGQGSDTGGDSAGAYGKTTVQTALGVGDDIYLFTAGFLYDGADALRQLLSAGCHGGGGLLAAVVDARAVSF